MAAAAGALSMYMYNSVVQTQSLHEPSLMFQQANEKKLGHGCLGMRPIHTLACTYVIINQHLKHWIHVQIQISHDVQK